jgi:hypothetical protein
VIAVGWGLFGLFAASQYVMDLFLLGFPDSHFTPYAEQTYTLRHVLVAACAIQGLYFLVMAFFQKRMTLVGLCLQIIVAATFIVAPMVIVPSCSQLPACVQAYELIMNTSFDDGAGG